MSSNLKSQTVQDNSYYVLYSSLNKYWVSSITSTIYFPMDTLYLIIEQTRHSPASLPTKLVCILVNKLHMHESIKLNGWTHHQIWTSWNDKCIEWQVNYGCQKFYIYLVQIKKTTETASFSIFNSWSKDNFHSTITYCKTTYTQIHIWKHTYHKSTHPMYILSIQLLIPQELSIHNWKNRKTTQNDEGLYESNIPNWVA